VSGDWIMSAIESMTCPMPDCSAELYVEHRLNRPIFTDDTAEEIADLNGAYTQNWQVVCTEGHVVLLPVDHAQDTSVFGADCSLGDLPDERCEHRDLERLQALVRQGVSP